MVEICEGGYLLTLHLSSIFQCEVECLIYKVGLKIYWLNLWIKLGLTKLFNPSVVFRLPNKKVIYFICWATPFRCYNIDISSLYPSFICISNSFCHLLLQVSNYNYIYSMALNHVIRKCM